MQIFAGGPRLWQARLHHSRPCLGTRASEQCPWQALGTGFQQQTCRVAFCSACPQHALWAASELLLLPS
jgi:hypothetical protein